MNKYVSPEGKHRHQCYKCGCVWEHENHCDDKHDDAHLCPSCHRCNMYNGIYEGPLPPNSDGK